ncbi:hypothetical protein [Chitinophaga nivalis]|uniref:Uncharacterized protein n=1 Tax=Chitinophaga nivalis TaxID=2991709 RepID=A0ABT3IFE4_9BACT|nr:hypothetical protein [Chitinophaga nivalis]MCW3467635.1 hypothetical protein [Chitinophaga nivalis]MCW3482673.1 hypothetical protein [Chitinophaga nivalis]
MSFCKNSRLKIKWALQQFDQFIDRYAEESLRITRLIKSALESPMVNILETIIPGDADTIFKHKVLQALETGIDTLSIVNTCRQQPSLEEKLICFTRELRNVPAPMQEAVLQKLQSTILRELDGNTKKQHLYDLFSQAKFSSKK